MSDHFDFKKEWEKTKQELMKLGKEATVLAKKGEEEFVKFSRQSKLHVDKTAVSLQREKLYYLIGKAYVASLESKSDSKGASIGDSEKLDALVKEFKTIEREERALNRKIRFKLKAPRGKSGKK